MKRSILSLFLIFTMLLSNGFCLAFDNGNEFSPVMQDMPEYTNYNSEYPLPNQNSYQTQNYKPVNNNYQPPMNNNNYNNYNNNNNYSNYNNYNSNYNDQLRGNVVMVPANTTFNAVMMTPISSENAKIGDNVTMFLGSDFYYGNHLIAGAGSRINGSIIKAKKGSYGNRNGQIQIKFSNIVTPSGQIIPLSASILTEDRSGILKAGTAMDTSKEYAKKAAIGAASGAVLGLVMGALSGGKVGKGAIYGTAVGGGLGLIQPVFKQGDNVEIPQNAQFDIVLDQPITVSSNTIY